MTLTIADREIGKDRPPFIIAEMSGNHNQSLERALSIVDAVAKTGADAIKLQTYTADTLTLKSNSPDFKINDSSNLWDGSTLHDLYNKAHTPWNWHKEIFNRARDHGLICFSSPFDESAVDFLEELNVPAYKIASFENNHIPLIRKVASTSKPLIISTGMAKISELELAVETAKEHGCKDLILLKCTSTYPASPVNSNIRTIPHMKNLFNCEIGLSDHTLGLGVATSAIAVGATVIEKHFTLSRKEGGIDSQFSLEPDEFSQLVIESKRSWESLGDINYGPTKDEESSKIFRRSIFASKNIKKGEKFTKKNIKRIRPGYGLEPKYYEKLLGKKSPLDISRANPLKKIVIKKLKIN